MTARRDPPSPDVPGALRPRSGPADVPVALLVAARRGDPGAFARVIEHWDPHLRTFVHLVLAGTGSTDGVLASAYVSAYRALPRYRADRTPGLWLHRLAYLAAADEIRRLTRDPRRRTARTHRDAAPSASTPDAPVREGVAALGRLAPDQRALAVLIDLEGFDSEAVAHAFDTGRALAVDRLGAARRVLGSVGDPPDVATTDGAAGPDTDRTADRAALPARVARLLASLEVPAAAPGFWPDLGRRLLAERERPAAPTIDPAARLARAQPGEGTFRPRVDGAAGAGPGTVATLADQADQQRPRRRWGRPLAIVAAVLLVVAVLGGALAIGLSGRTPDGSVTGRELADDMTAALDASAYVRVQATVREGADAGAAGTSRSTLTLADDGSWTVERLGTIDRTTYDGPAGIFRRVAAVGGTDGAPVTVLSAERDGLAPGAPDPAAEVPAFLGDLEAVGTLLRADGQRRAPATSSGTTPTWTFRRTVGTGPGGAAEQWTVVVRRSDGLPIRVDRRRDGQLVRQVRLTGWQPLSVVPDDLFRPAFPDVGTVDTEHVGFAATDISAVELLGRGPAITPEWLPTGFALTSVAIRGDAPAGTTSTAGGSNPPDDKVMSLGYGRGPERITVTTRTRGTGATWRDPFAESEAAARAADAAASTRRLGDGRFNQVQVRVDPDAVGRARLWGQDDDVVFTVAGDLTPAEAVRVASSLR